MSYQCSNPKQYIDHPVYGNGQCAVFVQAVTATPQTLVWKKGAAVKGNSMLVAGTAIATFDQNGGYASRPTGNHAALYLSQDARGIEVVEQYKGLEKVQKRHIMFRNGHGSPSNDGDAFCVIE